MEYPKELNYPHEAVNLDIWVDIWNVFRLFYRILKNIESKLEDNNVKRA